MPKKEIKTEPNVTIPKTEMKITKSVVTLDSLLKEINTIKLDLIELSSSPQNLNINK